MRRVMSLGSQADTVLGNHDLHMLAVIIAGEKMRSKDTFQDVISALKILSKSRYLSIIFTLQIEFLYFFELTNLQGIPE